MEVPTGIQINCLGNNLVTDGFQRLNRSELGICLYDSSLKEAGIQFLEYLGGYLMEHEPKIMIGDTFAYGCWLVKFLREKGGYIMVGEFDPSENMYVEYMNQSLRLWQDQWQLCSNMEVDFAPPRPDQMIVISDGVYEGATPLEGVRYPSPDHMCGWWLSTDEFEKNRQMKPVHLQHLLAKRFELAHFLALPFGHRFRVEDGEKSAVWFDGTVLEAGEK